MGERNIPDTDPPEDFRHSAADLAEPEACTETRAAGASASTVNEEREWRELFSIYRDYIKHEDGLVQHRLNTMLVFNGLVATGYTALSAYLLSQFWHNLSLTATSEGLAQAAVLLERQSGLLLLLVAIAVVGAVNSFYGAGDVAAARLSIATLRQKWCELVGAPVTRPADGGISMLQLLRASLIARDDVGKYMYRPSRGLERLPNVTFGCANRRQQRSDYALHLCLGILLAWVCLIAYSGWNILEYGYVRTHLHEQLVIKSRMERLSKQTPAIQQNSERHRRQLSF